MTTQNIKIASVLTIRMSSSRLPGKCMAEFGAMPLFMSIAKRASVLPGKVIIATSTDASDDPIEKVAKSYEFPLYRGSLDDVVARVDGAVKEYYPEANFVFRLLGDCPFLETEFVEHAARTMVERKAEAFLWTLAPDSWPVYGSREFPFSRSGWNRIVDNAKDDEREHSDQYFHRNRDRFKIVYHEPPASVYFRPYRLEIDWPDDLAMARAVVKELGPNPETRSVIRFLDGEPAVVDLNKERIEKTGPIASYVYQQRRAWMKAMTGQPVVGWDDLMWTPPSDKAVPVFCNSGRCMIGYGEGGILFTKAGDRIAGNAYKSCNCGAGKYWKQAKGKEK